MVIFVFNFNQLVILEILSILHLVLSGVKGLSQLGGPVCSPLPRPEGLGQISFFPFVSSSKCIFVSTCNSVLCGGDAKWKVTQ